MSAAAYLAAFGHMLYLRKADLPRANPDSRDFIRWALEGVPDYPRTTVTTVTTEATP